MKTFYFYTGVNPLHYPNSPTSIPFDCENVPEGSTFIFACDHPDLPDSKKSDVIVREIHNSKLISKFAYFKTKENPIYV